MLTKNKVTFITFEIKISVSFQCPESAIFVLFLKYFKNKNNNLKTLLIIRFELNISDSSVTKSDLLSKFQNSVADLKFEPIPIFKTKQSFLICLEQGQNNQKAKLIIRQRLNLLFE